MEWQKKAKNKVTFIIYHTIKSDLEICSIFFPLAHLSTIVIDEIRIQLKQFRCWSSCLQFPWHKVHFRLYMGKKAQFFCRCRFMFESPAFWMLPLSQYTWNKIGSVCLASKDAKQFVILFIILENLGVCPLFVLCLQLKYLWRHIVGTEKILNTCIW